MKRLWGEVLAGEIKRPGSFSLRTLDALRNISKDEAEIFVKVSKYVIKGSDNKYILPHLDDNKYLTDKYNIHLSDILLLRELGLLLSGDLQFILNASDLNPDIALTCGRSCILLRRPPGVPKTGIKSIFLTTVGMQLLNIIEKEEADTDYIKMFTTQLCGDNAQVFVVKK